MAEITYAPVVQVGWFFRLNSIFAQMVLFAKAKAASILRAAVVLWFSAALAPAHAQRDGSLTSDFSKLSAKERSKIAARETLEATKDSAYQGVMHRADSAFQADDYEGALVFFRKARKLRPYNVYPKVKIEDLQALIKKKAAQQASRDPVAKPPPPAPVDPVPPRMSARPTVDADTTPIVTPPGQLPLSPPPPARTIAEPRPAKHVASPAARPAPRQTPKAKPVEGERTYMEGGAVVVERTVEDDGQTVVYRRVAHSWGQVFYFKDGLAVPARVWRERFNE